jgi:putrescine transport system permease protein
MAGIGQRYPALMSPADDQRPSPPAFSSGPAVSAREMLDRMSGPLSAWGLAARALGWIERHGKTLIIAVPYLWLAVFFLVPFLIVLKLSFAEPQLAQPPYTPLFSFMSDGFGGEFLTIRLNLSNFLAIFRDDVFFQAYLNSIRIAATATLLTLAVGMPMAYAMAKAPEGWRLPLLMLVIMPFWTSFLIRVYAWIGILKNEGLLNALLLHLGVITEPLVILNTEAAVHIGIIYSYLPFMVLPLYASFEKMDPALVEAAIDLGCHPIKAFWLITARIALPGIIAGCLLVFIPAAGEFVIPDLLGGSETLMIGRTLWVEFFNNRDWPLASAVAIVLLLILVLPIVLFQHQQLKSGPRGT